MTGYDLDVVEVGDVVRFKKAGVVSEGEVIEHHRDQTGPNSLKIAEGGKKYCTVRYDEDIIGSGDYEIELLEWNDV